MKSRPAIMRTRTHGLFWILVATLVSLGAHTVGIVMTQVTIGLMRATTPFALAVRAHDLAHLVYFRCVAFPLTTAAAIAYLWPVIRYAGTGYAGPPSAVVQRRVLGTPLVTAAIGFGFWIVGVVYFVSLTVIHFGRWSPELMSQHVFSPLVAGFLASTTSYLLVERIMRAHLVPRVFPDGRVSMVAGVTALGVRARLVVLMLAIAFTPLFTMLGLFTAAEDRVASGDAIEGVLLTAVNASRGLFVFYLALGIGFTLMLARSLTSPLRVMAATLKRVQAGDLDVRVPVDSADEVGVLAEGVNAMVATLREREHILQTFGRVVEPSVRDYLLSGAARAEGELRAVSVLFADLRGFTGLAERVAPDELVATLNRYFTAMTAWVRECGGFVNKFLGDAMLVVFGLFDDAGGDSAARGAAAALRAATGMHARLAELNVALRAAGRPVLAVSVGIHTGTVLAGTIGAADRHEYTVVGDTVNVAARLQQLCTERDATLLASTETFELARRAGFAAPATAVGSVTLRGRQRPIEVVALG